MKKQLPKFIKMRRLKKVQKVQEKIASIKAKEEISHVVPVLVDAYDEDSGFFIGHAKFLSPLVDFNIKIVDNGNIEIGKIYNVKLTDFYANSYEGEIK